MSAWLLPERDVGGKGKAASWSEEEWAGILFHATNARRALNALWLCSPRESAARLRELALKTEIQGVKS